jgi:cytochrome c biogenesis protein CcmG, thiol:disulfide interchange protein DsbE
MLRRRPPLSRSQDEVLTILIWSRGVIGGVSVRSASMTRRLLFLLPVALFAVLVIAFAIGLRHDPHLLPSALIDRPAPDFALRDLYEGANGLARKDLEGQVSVVNFFASWCAPCREEHSELMALGRLSTVTLDGIAYKDKPEDSRRFLDRLGDPYKHLGVDREGTTAIDFGVYGVPETYVVDSTGHIRYRQVGPLTAEIVKETILPMIERLATNTPAPAGR